MFIIPTTVAVTTWFYQRNLDNLDSRNQALIEQKNLEIAKLKEKITELKKHQPKCKDITHIEQVALFFSSIIENNFFSTRICQKKDFF